MLASDWPRSPIALVGRHASRHIRQPSQPKKSCDTGAKKLQGHIKSEERQNNNARIRKVACAPRSQVDVVATPASLVSTAFNRSVSNPISSEAGVGVSRS